MRAHTWNEVPEADGCHGDEAKVKGLEEVPVFPNHEDGAADSDVDDEQEQDQHHTLGPRLVQPATCNRDQLIKR